MDWLHKDGLVRESILWHAPEGEPWLVTFDFAAVEDRLECVGVQLRSFIEIDREDEHGRYRAFLAGEVSHDDLLPKPAYGPAPSLLDVEATRAWLKQVEEAPYTPKHVAWQDKDAAWAIIADRQGGWRPETSPRALRATTLRELPLGDLLRRVRDQLAETWKSGILIPRTESHPIKWSYPDGLGEPIEDRAQISPEREDLEQRFWELLQRVKREGGWDDAAMRERDELGEQFGALEEREGPRPTLRRSTPTFPGVAISGEDFKRLTQQAATSFKVPGQKAGRPTKFSPAMLEMVAKTYRTAYAGGSSSPTKDVAKKLGITHSQAAKLVMRCRDPRIGLLGPTEMRRAGEARNVDETGSDAP
jgi:hypothetical protein